MVTREDIICFRLTDSELIEIIAKAKSNFSIVSRDNLRNRHPNIRFDCLLRGYVGEYVINRWLGENGIFPEAVNHRVEDENIDVDFLFKNRNIELKTSLIPSVDGTIENTIRKRDVKLIKRESNIENLRGDIHLQIYYAQKRKEKDNWLAQQEVNLQSGDLEYLYDALKVKVYRNSAYFVAWIDKPALIQRINAMPPERRTWTFEGAKRDFWNCKIRDAKAPGTLIGYLKQLPVLLK